MEESLIPRGTYLSSNINQSIKYKFISIVFSILYPQLAFITFVIHITHSIHQTYTTIYTTYSQGIFILSVYTLTIITSILYCNYENIRNDRSLPLFSFIYSLCLSYILSYFTILFNTDTLLLGCTNSLLSFPPLILFPQQNKISYTIPKNIFIILFISSLYMSYLIVYSNIYIHALYSILTSITHSVFLVYDTHRLINGSHSTFQLFTNDYILGSITLYLDIFNILPHLLQKI